MPGLPPIYLPLTSLAFSTVSRAPHNTTRPGAGRHGSVFLVERERQGARGTQREREKESARGTYGGRGGRGSERRRRGHQQQAARRGGAVPAAGSRHSGGAPGAAPRRPRLRGHLRQHRVRAPPDGARHRRRHLRRRPRRRRQPGRPAAAGLAVRGGERRVPAGVRPVPEPRPVHGGRPARAPGARRGAPPPRRRRPAHHLPRRRHLLRVAGHAGAEAGGPVRVRAHLQHLLPHGPAHRTWPLQLQRASQGHDHLHPGRAGDRADGAHVVPAGDGHHLRGAPHHLQHRGGAGAVHHRRRGADYVLCNTVEELEPSTIAALRAEKPFYAVGPIFPAGFSRSAVATSMWAESDCSRWLAAQPPGSVLYISFGSYAHVTREELREIAAGVLASGARFLWVLRPDVVSSDDPDPLPEGFAAAAGRGVVVPWCCQVEVLSHAAVGAFLTHCGWNSILESVWAGVPMLCFPLLTDQLTNRRLVAREWRAGVSIGDRGAVVAGEVRARIEGVMGGEEGVKLREQVRKLRGTLEAAVAPGGSSRGNFDEFVDVMKRRCGGH